MQAGLQRLNPGRKATKVEAIWLPRLPHRQQEDTASAQLPLWQTRRQVEPGETPPEAVFSVADRFVQANALPSAEALY